MNFSHIYYADNTIYAPSIKLFLCTVNNYL